MSSDSEEDGGSLNINEDGDQCHVMGDEIPGAQEENIWRNEDMELLIETVRSNPILFDVKSKDNKNSGKNELVWLNVSSTVGKDVPECKKKLKYLRDNFNKVVKKKRGKSGKSAKKEKQWEYFEMLNFLKPFVIANSESSGNLEKTPAPDETTNGRDRHHSRGPDLDEDDPIKPETISKKMKMSEKVDAALLGYLENQNIKDSNHHFFMALADDLRKMTTAQSAYAKIKIQQIMYEVEFPQNTTPVPGGRDVNE
ncbi:Transcription factor Adf-1 [Folsomia candida]|uniref:Transcription factor Adf-1 n=1 Tax=Folsomia candida TaxID=158441 RepID=A0A226DUT9_FOLCA|nr:Transcription factor Adf-1 [Folsomia candida]